MKDEISYEDAGMTFTQIGEAMGISTQSAYRIYSRAMRKLRRRFRSDAAGMLRLIDLERRGKAAL